MNFSDPQPIRVASRQVADNIQLKTFYAKLVKDMKMQQSQYLNQLCSTIDDLRKMCSGISHQKPEVYIDLYKNSLQLLKAIPWNDKTVKQLLGQGFKYRDSFTQQVFKPSPNIAYDIVASLFNIVAVLVYDCQKKTATEAGLKQKGEKFLQASYYCQLAATFIKQNQEYIRSIDDIYVGHSVFIGYQNLYLAQFIECNANIIILRSNGHPEQSPQFVQKLEQYWSYCVQLYQQSKQQLNTIIQMDKSQQLIRDIDSKLLNAQIAYSYLHVLLLKDTNKQQAYKDGQYALQLIEQLKAQSNQKVTYAQKDNIVQIVREFGYDSRLQPAAQETQLLKDCKIDCQKKIEQMNISLPLSIEPKEIFIPQSMTRILEQIKNSYQRQVENAKKQAIDYIAQYQSNIDQTLETAKSMIQAEDGGKVKELQSQLIQQNAVQELQNCKQLKVQTQQLEQQFEQQIRKLKDLEIKDTQNQQQFGIYWNSQQARQQIQQYTVYGIQCSEQLKSVLQGQQFNPLDQYNESDYQEALNYSSNQSQNGQNKQVQEVQDQINRIEGLMDELKTYKTDKSLLWVYERCADQELTSKITEQLAQKLAQEDKQALDVLKAGINNNVNGLHDKCKSYQKKDNVQEEQVEQQLQKLQQVLQAKQSAQAYITGMQNSYNDYQSKITSFYQQYTQQTQNAVALIQNRQCATIVLN